MLRWFTGERLILLRRAIGWSRCSNDAGQTRAATIGRWSYDHLVRPTGLGAVVEGRFSTRRASCAL